LRIITCPEWEARPARETPSTCGASGGIIFHHTASHLRQIDVPADESYDEACRYARDIQNFHMDGNGWIDSGHNFLVTRGGRVLQGRWGTVSKIENGQMVVSAHCPNFNTWVGIEHEHKSGEAITDAQYLASAWLQAWIAFQYGRRTVLPVDGHRDHYATECPSNLYEKIDPIRNRAQKILDAGLAV
jgi:hypothetical protein